MVYLVKSFEFQGGRSLCEQFQMLSFAVYFFCLVFPSKEKESLFFFLPPPCISFAHSAFGTLSSSSSSSSSFSSSPRTIKVKLQITQWSEKGEELWHQHPRSFFSPLPPLTPSPGSRPKSHRLSRLCGERLADFYLFAAAASNKITKSVTFPEKKVGEKNLISRRFVLPVLGGMCLAYLEDARIIMKGGLVG